MVANNGRVQWDELRYSGGVVQNILVRPPEVCKGLVDSFAKGNARFWGGAERLLHGTEDVSSARESQCHAAQFSEGPVSPFFGGALLSG